MTRQKNRLDALFGEVQSQFRRRLDVSGIEVGKRVVHQERETASPFGVPGRQRHAETQVQLLSRSGRKLPDRESGAVLALNLQRSRLCRFGDERIRAVGKGLEILARLSQRFRLTFQLVLICHAPNNLLRHGNSAPPAGGAGNLVFHLSKRLLIYAPPREYWTTIAQTWDNTLLFPSEAGKGLDKQTYSEILNAICGSV